jgi:hypothetical protein
METVKKCENANEEHSVLSKTENVKKHNVSLNYEDRNINVLLIRVTYADLSGDFGQTKMTQPNTVLREAEHIYFQLSKGQNCGKQDTSSR